MNTQTRTRLARRPWWVTSSSALVAVAVGVATGCGLHGYDLPALAALTTAGALGMSVLAGLLQVTAPRPTVYRCPDPGCEVQIRVTGASAGDSRRWQELAADHTRHSQP